MPSTAKTVSKSDRSKLNRGAGMTSVGEKTMPRFRMPILLTSEFAAMMHRCAKLNHCDQQRWRRHTRENARDVQETQKRVFFDWELINQVGQHCDAFVAIHDVSDGQELWLQLASQDVARQFAQKRL